MAHERDFELQRITRRDRFREARVIDAHEVIHHALVGLVPFGLEREGRRGLRERFDDRTVFSGLGVFKARR